MNQQIKIRKGLDLRIEGVVAATTVAARIIPDLIAIVPDDFHGFVPKMEVKDGDAVKTGRPLMFDKRDSEIKLVSPVDGVVKAVVRGERRKIERVEIIPAATQPAPEAVTPQLGDSADIRVLLKRSGLWAMMRQRPYDIVPTPDSEPRDIYVTAIDSAPLAVNPATFYAADSAALAAGVKLLAAQTRGRVYVARREGELADIPGAVMLDVKGPHPAGNVGVHIANTRPVNKGEVVWTLDLATLWRLGVLATKGYLPANTFVAVTGSEVEKPRVVETLIGAPVEAIIRGNIKEDSRHHRIISGNVLTGKHVGSDDFLRFPYRQITVIPEGDDVVEFMGWASLSPKKMSTSRSFPGHFLKGRLFNPDARLLGGKRAFIMSGEYERYMPMDILAEQLIKAVIGRDIEKMESLGIYEVAPEDFALGEYSDTSKLETQKIIREGLDYLRAELE